MIYRPTTHSVTWFCVMSVTLSTLSSLLKRSASCPSTVVRELWRPFSSRTNRDSTASSMSIRSAHKQTGRQVGHRKRRVKIFEYGTHSQHCMWPCVSEWLPVPGSLSSIDSASSQTMSSLLLAPCWAEERGLISSMTLIRVRVSWRYGEK